MRFGAALIVEDEHAVQYLLRVILRKHCDSVDIADDGEVALEMLRAREYDLVMLDLMLPKVDGITVSKAIAQLAKPISRHYAKEFPEGTVVLQKPFDVEKVEKALLSFAG
jgi:CheY-like chemotaxis protein